MDFVLLECSYFILRYKLQTGIYLTESWFPFYIHDSIAVGIYVLLRAVDRFAANYNSFPGQFDR